MTKDSTALFLAGRGFQILSDDDVGSAGLWQWKSRGSK